MILALRALGIGDLAAAVPAIRGLRRAFPGETLALAAPSGLAPLIDLIGGVDRLVPTDGLAAPIRAADPDVAIDLHGYGADSRRLLRATRPGALWAYATGHEPGREREPGCEPGPDWVEDEHEVYRWCRLLRFYGVVAEPSDLALAVPDDAGETDVTIVHPGARSSWCRWPADRFAAVARHLHAAGHRVLITGTPQEHELAVRVAAGAGLPGDAVPLTSLAQLAGLVARARLLISGDTGIAHLATAYGTPSVVLFGPMSPARWGPPPDRPWHRAIWHGIRSEPGGRPWPAVHPALLAVTAAEVIVETERV